MPTVRAMAKRTVCQGTWRRVQEKLGLGNGLFRRYLGKFTEGEGAFGICSFWAVEFLASGGGSLSEAQDLFETLLRRGNDVGLYAEEIEPRTGAALGNFPQAYTHVGLINAALTLQDRAERGARDSGQRRLHVPEAHA
jgi:GH15 family glucan-1,4-alpha-glucosidase